MKTITELNHKWWYRLVKVVFIGFVLLCALASVVLIADENSPRQVSDYKVDCVADYTNHRSFYAWKDEDIYIFMYGSGTVYSILSESARESLREACDISEEEAKSSNQKALNYISSQPKGTPQEEIQSYIDRNFRPYILSDTRVTEGGYDLVVFYSIVALLILIVIAEIIRRVFYYIILGSIRPQK